MTHRTPKTGPAEKPARILYLEDEFIVSMSFTAVLEDANLGEVHAVSTLPQAAAVLDQGPVSVAILDVDINGEPSLPLARKIKASGGRVLFATGYGEERGDLGEVSEAVLRKPYTEEQLTSSIKDMLASRT